MLREFVYESLERISALFEVFEKVEAGAGGREQYDVARCCGGSCEVNSFFIRACAYDLHRCVIIGSTDRSFDLVRRRTDEDECFYLFDDRGADG